MAAPAPASETPTLLPGEWASPEDLAQLYRALLGREAEDFVLAALRPRPLHELVAEMCASDEINREVLHAIVQGRELPHDRLGNDTLAALGAWLQHRLRCGGIEEAEQEEDAGASQNNATTAPA